MTDMTVFSAAVILFLVMDPVGNIPSWLPILADVPARRRKWIILRENVIALVILLGFLYFGPAILAVLHVERPALEVAGGVVIFLIALRLVFSSPKSLFVDDELHGEPFVVPLAVPLLAGPSAAATVMLLAKQSAAGPATVLYGLLLAWSVGLAVLLAGEWVARLLGRRGMLAVQRLMGLLLTVIAVQMVMTGMVRYLQQVAEGKP